MQATLFLAPREVMVDVYFTRNIKTLVDQHFAAYEKAGVIEVSSSKDELDACEEWFELTNNPFRQEEREEKYGRGRSVSVGDIVQVGENAYVCASCGWERL